MRLESLAGRSVTVSGEVDPLQWFHCQLAFWKHAVSGDALEISALVAENPVYADQRARWDRTAAELSNYMRATPDGGWCRVADWAALPWVIEHIVRHHIEHPGL